MSPNWFRHPRSQRKEFKPVLAPYDFVFDMENEQVCLSLTRQQIALLLSTIDYLYWPTRWFSELGQEIDIVRTNALVNDMVRRLITVYDCDTKEPLPIEKPKDFQLSGSFLDDCEDDCEEDMGKCGNDISDLIRVEGTKFQIRVIDECGDCQWKTLFDVRTGAISEKFDDILNEAGDLIDDAFDGFGLDTIQTPERRDENIIRCVKATSLVNALWEYSAAMLAVGDGITPNIDDNSIMSLNNITEFLGGAFAGLTLLGVPAAIASELIGAASSGALLIYGINEAYDEVREWMDDVTNKQKLICHMTKVMSARNQLLGSDVAAAVNKIEDTAIGLDIKVAEWLTKVMRALDIRKTSEYIGLAKVSEPCGCPELTIPAGQIPALDTDLYDWSAVIDFKLDDFTYGAVQQGGLTYGTWELGVGWKAAKDLSSGDGKRTFLWITDNTGFDTARVTAIDLVTKNVTKGTFHADLEKAEIRIYSSQNQIGILPLKSGTQRFSTFTEMNAIRIFMLIAYCEIHPAGQEHNVGGDGILEKMIVYGKGTRPPQFSVFPSVT